MRIPSTVFRFILAPVGVLLSLAPTAGAQSAAPLIGDPFPYRLDVPAGARIERDGSYVTAELDNAFVLTGAVDMVVDSDRELAGSDREARRRMTERFAESDSLLLDLIQDGMRLRNVQLEGTMMEIRTLGGQRAGYVRGRVDRAKDAPWIETYVTVRDGILYMLAFMGTDQSARVESLAAQIHGSFVLPDALPATLRAPARPTGGVPRRIE